eukprot:1768780-Prymnesium_polylepis.1
MFIRSAAAYLVGKRNESHTTVFSRGRTVRYKMTKSAPQISGSAARVALEKYQDSTLRSGLLRAGYGDLYATTLLHRFT